MALDEVADVLGDGEAEAFEHALPAIGEAAGLVARPMLEQRVEAALAFAIFRLDFCESGDERVDVQCGELARVRQQRQAAIDRLSIFRGEMFEIGAIIEERSGLIGHDDFDRLSGLVFDDEQGPPRKFYVDAGVVEIAAHLVYELDADGRRLQVKRFTEYTAESVRNMYPSAADLRTRWSAPEERAAIIAALEERGISFEELAEVAKQPDADPFDLLCNVAYSAPIRSRRERAEAARIDGNAFFDRFTNGARQVLNELLEKYVEFGTAQFQIPDILKVPPLSEHGNVIEIAELFGGPEQLRAAVGELQQLLYAA